jgi:hypothetical protein
MFNIDKYKDIHKGETCYIFGDGPSIKWFDMSKFNDHIGISCGVIPFHNDFSKLNIKYSMIVEPWYFCPTRLQSSQHNKEHKKVSEAHRVFMNSNKNIEFFINLSNFPWEIGKNINYVHRALVDKKSKLHKVKEINDPFGGSFHATLSLAYLMGFSKVYLVGFDAWTIQPSRTLRWYELGEGEFFEATNFADKLLNVIKENIDVYTISKDGNSCNVKNISYKKFTNQEPEFKENYQLLSSQYLDILNTCPDYKIYE